MHSAGSLGARTDQTSDWQLLYLERMRLINIAHYWADGTHKTYQDQLRMIRNFESAFDFCCLRPTLLLAYVPLL
jgi:hypothetical protein